MDNRHRRALLRTRFPSLTSTVPEQWLRNWAAEFLPPSHWESRPGSYRESATGGMNGWSVPICLVKAAAAASAAAWAAIMATFMAIAAAVGTVVGRFRIGERCCDLSGAPQRLVDRAGDLADHAHHLARRLGHLARLAQGPGQLAHLQRDLGRQTWKQCMQMSMLARTAREPPMYTFDEPVMISNRADRGGTTPMHVGLSPKSPHRAVGLLLTKTRRHVPSMTGPIGGNGIGGKGGGLLGGCLSVAVRNAQGHARERRRRERADGLRRAQRPACSSSRPPRHQCPRDGRAEIGKHAQDRMSPSWRRVGQLLDGLDHLVNLLQSLGDRLLHVLGGNRLVGVRRRLRHRDGLRILFWPPLSDLAAPLSPLFSFRKSPTPGIEDVSATNSNAHALTRFTLHSLRLCNTRSSYFAQERRRSYQGR